MNSYIPKGGKSNHGMTGCAAQLVGERPMFKDFRSTFIPIFKDFPEKRKCLSNFPEIKPHFILNVKYEGKVATNQVSELT